MTIKQTKCFTLPMIEYEALDAKGHIKLSFWIKYLTKVINLNRNIGHLSEPVEESNHLLLVLKIDKLLQFRENPIDVDKFLKRSFEYYSESTVDTSCFKSFCVSKHGKRAQLQLGKAALINKAFSSNFDSSKVVQGKESDDCEDTYVFEHSLEYLVTYQDCCKNNKSLLASWSFLIDCCAGIIQEKKMGEGLIFGNSSGFLTVSANARAHALRGQVIRVRMFSNKTSLFHKRFLIDNVFATNVLLYKIDFVATNNQKL